MAAYDVIIVGAGAVGAASAYFAARAGLSVLVLDRDSAASGTSSHGEGNVLVSDKEAGPELDLALYSNRLWHDELGEFGPLWEFQDKGGVVVSRSASSMEALSILAGQQRRAGIAAETVDADGIRELEPRIAPDIAGGAWYPEDAQVQPVLATWHLLRLARAHGAELRQFCEVTGLLRDGDRVVGVATDQGEVRAPVVVNAAGPWGAELAAMAHVGLPVEPRRGFVMVTEPVPPTVFHKVYAAEYVGDVGSGDAAMQSSPVVESTASGTILIGSTRERVGFDPHMSVEALRLMAVAATSLYPCLEKVSVIRSYWGFRPYCSDHLPVIGPDPRAPGLWHACGHEGAGIGLAPGTGKLLSQLLTGQSPGVDPAPFRPERFEEAS